MARRVRHRQAQRLRQALHCQTQVQVVVGRFFTQQQLQQSLSHPAQAVAAKSL
jgi:hypothetical protein